MSITQPDDGHVPQHRPALSESDGLAEPVACVAAGTEPDELVASIRSLPFAVAKFDREMRYLAASARWLRDYGLGPDAIGRSQYDLFPDIPPRWKDVHQRALRGETIRSSSDVFQQRDGTVTRVCWEVRPWHVAGEVMGIIIFAEQLEPNPLGRPFLTVCAHCKSVRDESLGWVPLEWYLGVQTGVSFTHSVCHPCAGRLYGQKGE